MFQFSSAQNDFTALAQRTNMELISSEISFKTRTFNKVIHPALASDPLPFRTQRQDLKGAAHTLRWNSPHKPRVRQKEISHPVSEGEDGRRTVKPIAYQQPVSQTCCLSAVLVLLSFCCTNPLEPEFTLAFFVGTTQQDIGHPMSPGRLSVS